MESRKDLDSPHDKVDRIEAPVGDILGEACVTVDVPVKTAFAFWRHLENLSQFMQHVNKVERVSNHRYAWTVDGPLGASVSWEATTDRMVENELISWHSVKGSEVENSGSVHFKSVSERSTEIRVKLAYTPPAGKLGHFVASILGKNPEQQMADDLKTLQTILVPTGTSATH